MWANTKDLIKHMIIKGSRHCCWKGGSDHIMHSECTADFFFVSSLIFFTFRNLRRYVNKVQLYIYKKRRGGNKAITWTCNGVLKCFKMSHITLFATKTHCLLASFFLFCVVNIPLFVGFSSFPFCFFLLFCLSSSRISTSIYSQFVFLCSHITKVMGLLVKNIFACATLFFCSDFSSTHVSLCM